MTWSDTLRAKECFALGFIDYLVVPDFLGVVVDYVRPDDVVLSFGCGSADYKNKIWCKRVVRVDHDFKVNPDYERVDDCHEKIDLVFAESVIEHLSLAEIRHFFEWCNQNAKTLVFNSPNPWAPYGAFASDYDHKTLLNMRAYGGLLVESGYSDVQFYRQYAGQFVWLRQLIARVTGVDFAHQFVVIAKRTESN